MGKRKRWLIAAVTVALLAVLVWVMLPGPATEPVYDGKSLSEWLVQMEDSDSPAERQNAESAIQHIGTNAIPTLLRMLRSDESPFRAKFLAYRHGWYDPFALLHFWQPPDARARAQAGFAVLGADAAGAVPELAGILDENRSRESVRRTAAVLGEIGLAAKAAVPALLRAAVSTKTSEHFYEFEALGKIHSEPDLVVPVLVQVMSNSPEDRMYAVMAAGKFKSEAKAAVPELLVLLNDPTVRSNSPRGKGFISDRTQVERALEQIDPEKWASLNQAAATSSNSIPPAAPPRE